MAEKIIFQLQDLRKFYGQREVLRGITLSFLDGAKIGVIGPNGAGKSTLLSIIAGEDTAFEGIAKPLAGLTIGFLSQEPPLNDEKDVAGNLEEAVQPIRDLVQRFEDLSMKLGEVTDDDRMNELLEEQAQLQEEIEHKEAWELDSRLEQAATALCLPPLDADVKVLSGGERRRVALCKLLMEHPDLLLLDEPTNHLDTETVEWLEHHLADYHGTVILITHDRYFLDNVVGWMLEVERGRGKPYEGNYSAYLGAKQRALDVKRQADSRMGKLLEREKEWLGRTPAARMRQSKARIQRYKELVERRAEDQLEDSVELRIPPGPRLGDKVISFDNVTKGFGGRVLIKDLSFDLPAGAILGVVGANGTGKTTMLRMILGQEQTDSGRVTIGPTVKLTYLDQSRMILDDSKSVYDNITEGNDRIPFGQASIDGRAYVARFNFRGEDQQKLLGECSGGMRNRVLLARMLKNAANVIMLDEPTNDLDLDTLRVLEEAIMEYPGSAIVVSHDRYFLNRVVSHILAFEGDGLVNFHYGTYESYAEWRKEWRAKMGIKPESRAGKYRKLLRSR
ncbi:MAG: energy-dependent translational throttle protein EttA [Planctomycetota bacterium]|nr:energy-dependent translational throttle protein EttA [Planctomycetota bacterium]